MFENVLKMRVYVLPIPAGVPDPRCTFPRTKILELRTSSTESVRARSLYNYATRTRRHGAEIERRRFRHTCAPALRDCASLKCEHTKWSRSRALTSEGRLQTIRASLRKVFNLLRARARARVL